MGDNGKLYPGFDNAFAKRMAKLCENADIIVPNLTEASFMLDLPYVASGYSREYIEDLLIRLTNLGAKKAVLTGISFENGKLGVYGYDSHAKEFFSYYREHLPVSFHGTGDVFASTLCGALSLGNNLSDALAISVDYTVECITKTMQNNKHNWYGVDFESAIPYLIKRISN